MNVFNNNIEMLIIKAVGMFTPRGRWSHFVYIKCPRKN